MDNGYSLIHLAAWYGHIDIFKFIASKVENLNLPGPDGRTALQLATTNGHTEIVKFLKVELDVLNQIKLLLQN